MKLESVPPAGTALTSRASEVLTGRRLIAALVFAALFWLFSWYFDTAASIVAIWERSDTFAHGYLIAPISAWLIWQRRHVLAGLTLRPALVALPLLALVGFGWLLARLAGVAVVQQFGLALMIPLAVWALLGTEVIRALAFPLAFLVFAVPFGEFLEPVLMEHTANFTVAALKLTGIPVYREGMYFTIPSGSWSIVEACSGLRYLIASLTLGLLYAYLTYRSFTRRALFVVASVIVPIVANWLRAYMIVMIGHLSNMQYAAGVDHLIYGWLFFGVVMLILFWIGSYWREDLPPPGAQPATVARPAPCPISERSLGAVAMAALLVSGIVAAWPLAAARIEDQGNHVSPALMAPQASGGWQPADRSISNWTPRFYNSQAAVNQSYSNGADRAGLTIVYYRYQRPGAQLISTVNTIVSTNDREWRRIGEARRDLVVGERQFPAIEASVTGPSARLVVWRWYWVDGSYLVNPYQAKLLQAKSMLFGRGDDGAVVIVYTPVGTDLPAAQRVLQDFVRGMLPGIDASLENARRTAPAS